MDPREMLRITAWTFAFLLGLAFIMPPTLRVIGWWFDLWSK